MNTEALIRVLHDGGSFVKTGSSACSSSFRDGFIDCMNKMAVAIDEGDLTFNLQPGETLGHVVSRWNSEHPYKKITVQQLVQANGGLDPTKYRAGKEYRLPGSANVSPVVDEQPKPTRMREVLVPGTGVDGYPARYIQVPVEDDAQEATKEQPDTKAVKDKKTGRVYYINFPKHRIGLTGVTGGGGQSKWDKAVTWIKDKTGWDGKFEGGHAGILFRDADGRTKYYEYGRYPGGNVGYSSNANGGYFGNFRNVKVPDFKEGTTEEQYLELLAKRFPGEPVVEMHGADAPHLAEARSYIEDMAADKNREAYSVGGNNCGSVARRAFDVARGWDTTLGKAFDVVGGFTPGRNAPTLGADDYTYKRPE